MTSEPDLARRRTPGFDQATATPRTDAMIDTLARVAIAGSSRVRSQTRAARFASASGCAAPIDARGTGPATCCAGRIGDRGPGRLQPEPHRRAARRRVGHQAQRGRRRAFAQERPGPPRRSGFQIGVAGGVADAAVRARRVVRRQSPSRPNLVRVRDADWQDGDPHRRRRGSRTVLAPRTR